MTIQQLMPYIFSATAISFILASLSVFVDMITNTNLESKLMPLKKYVRNLLTIIICISILLSILLHFSLILSGDIVFFKRDENDNSYLIDYTTLVTVVIMTLLIVALMSVASIFIFLIGKILEVKADYFIKELEEEAEWMLVKITYNDKLLLKKSNSNSKREYKILDSLESKIIEEKIELKGWKKRFYTTMWFQTTIFVSIVIFIFCLAILMLYEDEKFNLVLLIPVLFFLVSSLSTLLFSIGFKYNLKKLNLLN